MKLKKAVALFTAVVLVVAMLPFGAMAAGEDHRANYFLYLDGEADGVKFEGRDTLSIDFSVKTANGKKVHQTQAILFAYDNTVFELLTYDATNSAYHEDVLGAVTPGNGLGSVSSTGIIERPTTGWSDDASHAISADGKIGYVALQPNRGSGQPQEMTTAKVLQAVRLAYRENKSSTDLNNSSIRLVTPVEEKKLSQDSIASTHDGRTQWKFGTRNDTVATPNDDNINAPTFTFPGSEKPAPKPAATSLEVTMGAVSGGTAVTLPVKLPAVGTAATSTETFTYLAKNAESPIGDETTPDVEWKLMDAATGETTKAYTGVTINATTGAITVTHEAAAGTVYAAAFGKFKDTSDTAVRMTGNAITYTIAKATPVTTVINFKEGTTVLGAAVSLPNSAAAGASKEYNYTVEAKDQYGDAVAAITPTGDASGSGMAMTYGAGTVKVVVTQDNQLAGDITVTATSGITKTLKISTANLPKATMEVTSPVTYTGANITPVVVVKTASGTPIPASKYRVEYSTDNATFNTTLPKNVGTYNIKVVFTDDALIASDEAPANGTFVVNKAPVTITVPAFTQKYLEPVVVAFTATGLLGSDTVANSLVSTLVVAPNQVPNITPYDVTGSVKSTNYNVTLPTLTDLYTVTKGTIVPDLQTINASSKTLADVFGANTSGKKVHANSTSGVEVAGTFTWIDGEAEPVVQGKTYAWKFVPTTAADAQYFEGKDTTLDQINGTFTPWPSAASNYFVSYDPMQHGKITAGSATEAVRMGDSPKNPPVITADKNFKFVGWSLDGTTVIELDTVKTNKTTILKAVYKDDKVKDKHIAYTSGTGDGKFSPDANLTRAQVAVFIAKMHPDFDATKTYTNKFTDIPEGAAANWYRNEVAFCAEQGIFTGVNDAKTEFAPNRDISRAEIAKVFASYLKLEKTTTDAFVDVEDSWAYGEIAALYKAGYISGTGETDGKNYFAPKSVMTRASIVTMINKVMGRTPDKASIDAATFTNPFTDVPTSHWAYRDIMEATVEHDVDSFHVVKAE